jgi:hypothetical protein
MKVLCAWINDQGDKDSMMIESPSRATLMADFKRHRVAMCKKWDEIKESFNLNKGPSEQQNLPCWIRPSNAVMTWYLPESQEEDYSDDKDRSRAADKNKAARDHQRRIAASDW